MGLGISTGRKIGVLLLGCAVGAGFGAQTKKKKSAGTPSHHASGKSGAKGKTVVKGRPGKAHAAGSRATGSRAAGIRAAGRAKSIHGRAVAEPKETLESQRLRMAFTASAQLRPMAQQLVVSRSASAYNGVLAYAGAHPGEPAATANLAVGHAYMMDRRYTEAALAFHAAGTKSVVLGDYADYLQAQADVAAKNPQAAIPLLLGFADRYPGSLFVASVPVALAQAYLAAGDAGDALKVLAPLQSGETGGHADFNLVLAQAYQATGDAGRAASLYRHLYLDYPLSAEAGTAKTALGTGLNAGERKRHADALFNAKQFAQAAVEYRAIQQSDSGLGQADKDALQIYVAVCDLRLKKLSRNDVERLPVTNDDSAALKLYLQSELARNEGHSDTHDALVQQLTVKYPQSRWLEEALYSGGNMYLIQRDATKATADYVALAQHFPHSTYAPSSHWHAAWLSYRMRRYPDAARLMEEQIVNYPGGAEIPGALYWRGRMYEDIEHDFSQALNFYQAANASYVNSYYAILSRQRIAVIGKRDAAAPAAVLASVRTVDDPHLTDALPENDPHLIKARLLANAALNEYIRPEIQMSPTAGQWGALAEAEIYQSFGEDTRALQAMKRSKIPFFSLPVSAVPLAYWRLVFPRPYWNDLSADAQAHGLDPYLVAALIRQESEFNPGAVSRANAYGLMQLLPSVGKSLAKQQGDRHFATAELLDPQTNLKLGTLDLRKTLDRWGGQVEYALASYNAGDTPVHAWVNTNDYKDVPEWVESIPYTETREYVQGILRNKEVYRAVYAGK